jgi:CBS domain-containing protein
VADIMTKNPITVPRSGPLPKAARVMLENKITALPVVDERREMVGIITTSDIFRFIRQNCPILKKSDCQRLHDQSCSHAGSRRLSLEAHR